MQPTANNNPQNNNLPERAHVQNTPVGLAADPRPQPHIAGIHPVNPRQERPSFFQRVGQIFQSLRACSGRQVLDQVDVDIAAPPSPEESEIEIFVPPFTAEETHHVLPPLSAVTLALNAIDRQFPRFAQESDLHSQLRQLFSSLHFQNAIDYIRRELTQNLNDTPVQLTQLVASRFIQNGSQTVNGQPMPYSVELVFQAEFSTTGLAPLELMQRQRLTDGRSFRVNFNSEANPNLSVILSRGPIVSIVSIAPIIERGQEFNILSALLQSQAAIQINKVQYQSNGQNEGAIDMGGPLRECFTQAYEQALNVLMSDTSLQGARKDINNDLDRPTVEVRALPLNNFGRLLAHVADQPNVNLPPHLFKQSFEAILTLANHSQALGFEGQNNLSDLLQSATQALSDNKAVIVDIVETLLPEIKTSLETHFGDPLAKYADASKPTPEEAKEALSDYLSDHLEQALGLCYSPESDTVIISEGNTRFLQLALIANGFNDVRKARTNTLHSVYPTEIQALVASINGTGDIRRALSDPTYEKVFTITDESQSISRKQLNIFKGLIHQWAGKASDEQLSLVCRAITSSDVLPDRISNGTNRLSIQIRNIPVVDPASQETVAYAEFSPHTCFGTLEIAPEVVQAILAEHQQNSEQIPARLERLLGEDLPSESRAFNAA